MTNKAWKLVFTLVLTAWIGSTACRARTVVVDREVTRVVTREYVVEQTVEVIQEVTRVVIQPETVQVEVTPTSTPIPRGGFLRMTATADADLLNPLLSADSTSANVESLIWDSPFQTDPWTGETLPGLVERWEMLDGNKTVIYHLHQGCTWSDGVPITARDMQFTFDALRARDPAGKPVLADSPYLDLVENVETIERLDEYTLKVTYADASCTNLDRMNLRWLPAHVYQADPGFSFADLSNDPRNRQPTVFSGPFMLKEWIANDHITLVRNPSYWQGAPYLDGVVIQIVADAAAEQDALKTSQSDIGAIEPRYLTEMEQVPALSIYKLPGPSYEYIALQMGDPRNPQPRLNRDGTLNEKHGVHPILSRKEVRQSIAYAIDRVAIINRVRMGQAILMNAEIEPLYRWAYNDELVPREYDPQKAAQMLDAAGWVLDGKTGIRACQGCGTTRDGTPMILSLKTNVGDGTRQEIGLMVQQDLKRVGIQVDLRTLEWKAFLDTALSQDFDLIIGGWKGGSEDKSPLFAAQHDVPNAGFNMVSFYHPDYEALSVHARALEGCSYEKRGAIYRQLQQILYDEQPYIWLYANRQIVGINQRLGNVNPGPWSVMHTVYQWYVRQ